jgi:hypothetical protein
MATVLTTCLGVPAALAQQVEHGRGNIVSVDFEQSKVELRDPQGRTGTRTFARDATVRFTDGASFFANPSVHDLRAPMYVHYMFRNDVIEEFEVVELGFDPAVTVRKGQGKPRTVVGRVTAYDAGRRQLEVEHPDGRETFQLTERSKTSVAAGDRVELRTEWSGARELVVELRVLPDSGRERKQRKP